MEAYYEVWLRDKRTGNRRSIILWANSFGKAEELVLEGRYTRMNSNITNDEEVGRIDKEYDAASVGN